MYKIGEFSKINRVTVKALRVYDKLGLLKPALTDDFTGYRYYKSSQLVKIQKILALKQIGFSLSEIAILLDSKDEDYTTHLSSKNLEIKKIIESHQQKLENLNYYLNTLQKENKMDYHVTVKDLPEVIVASMRKVIKDYSEFNNFYPTMGKLMIEQKLECSKPEYCFSIYHDGEFKVKDIDVEICQAVVKAGKDKDGMVFKTVKAVPKAACVFHKGPYDTIGKAYAALVTWIDENGYKPGDNMREAYYDGIWNKEDPADWLTEIQAPIVKK